MYEIRLLLRQLYFAQDFTVASSHPVLHFTSDWMDPLKMFIAPSLVPPEVLLFPVVSQEFKGALCFDRNVLLTHMAPRHMRIMQRSAGPEMKDQVHRILEKNSTFMGTPRVGTRRFVLGILHETDEWGSSGVA